MNPNLEYLKFIEPLLSYNIIEFIGKQKVEEATQKYLENLKQSILSKSLVFHDENSSDLQQMKEQFAKREKELVNKNESFLNLLANCRRSKNYTITSSITKKIVLYHL